MKIPLDKRIFLPIAIGALTGLIIGIGATAYGSSSQPDIEGAGERGWIEVGQSSKAKRIYDKDAQAYCWIVIGPSGGYGIKDVSISCVKESQ